MVENKRALLIIDMLNDFVREDGALPVPQAAQVIDNIKKLREEFHSERSPVIFVNDTHDSKDTEFGTWPKHAVKGTEGAQVVDEIKPKDDDYIIEKRRYSGFFGTSLELLLNELEIKEIYLTGTVTNICIYSTALDGYMRGYKIYVPADCVAGLDPIDHKQALKQMKELMGAEIV